MSEPAPQEAVRGSIRAERTPNGNVILSSVHDRRDPGWQIQRRDLDDALAALTVLHGPLQPQQTVYAHVERTVHVLLDEIAMNRGAQPDRVKTLAEAVQALSSWPQFNPMNAHEQYAQLAEHAVERAIKAYQDAPKIARCSCGVGVDLPEPWHKTDCAGRSTR